MAERVARDGKHLVVAGGADLHRILLRADRIDGPLAAVVPFDAMTGLRLQAVAALDSWLSGAARAKAPALYPTRYQAGRLALLLAIFDLRADDPHVSSHAIARRLIYPRMSVGRGAEWKASAERRRTQRLIREAEALVSGGYLALLAGRLGRQK